MSKFASLLTLVAFVAHAEVIEVKDAVIVTPEDTTVEVHGGAYFGQDNLNNLQDVFTSILAQNEELTAKLVSANKKIVECTAFVPGLPAWAYVAITTALSVLTIGVGFFALKDVK
jgi:hypothetical protein